MRRITKILSSALVSVAGLVALASCGKDKFYKEWSAAGATVEEDNCFTVLSLDEVTEKREDKENFLVFVGSSGNSSAVTLVSNIQAEADNLNYEGTLYFVNVKDALSNLTEGKETVEALGVKEIDAGSDGLIAVCYHEGDIYFDTSNPNDQLDRFCIAGSSVDFIALADYAFELYPVEK